eukprot:TRINITY_DN1356_c0_g1_i1.p2 TRINITY_DN1356_c0_g1~~TRINITY_DN1356_c0_g1_i1.p2  ORF type:complete len:103 (+),score=17.21 TRINITY_DN1356_c0_g1_i1:200-508(+)
MIFCELGLVKKEILRRSGLTRSQKIPTRRHFQRPLRVVSTSSLLGDHYYGTQSEVLREKDRGQRERGRKSFRVWLVKRNTPGMYFSCMDTTHGQYEQMECAK